MMALSDAELSEIGFTLLQLDGTVEAAAMLVGDRKPNK